MYFSRGQDVLFQHVSYLFTFASTILLTIITINTTSFSPRRSSFSSIPQPYPFQTLLLTTSRYLERQHKDFDVDYLVQFCQLRRKEWHENLQSARATSPGPDTTLVFLWPRISASLDTTRRVGMDDQKHEPYFDWEKFCLHMVAQQIDPWSMMSEVWEGEKIAKELSKGRVYHWKAEPTGQVNLHR